MVVVVVVVVVVLVVVVAMVVRMRVSNEWSLIYHRQFISLLFYHTLSIGLFSLSLCFLGACAALTFPAPPNDPCLPHAAPRSAVGL